MDTSPEEQIEILTMISDAQREKINTLLKNIDDLKKERDELRERATMLEAQVKNIEASKDNSSEAA
jgi:uncharacterized coiled-coil DUF342 family protein